MNTMHARTPTPTMPRPSIRPDGCPLCGRELPGGRHGRSLAVSRRPADTGFAGRLLSRYPDPDGRRLARGTFEELGIDIDAGPAADALRP